jgi:hypothetical protein
VFKKKRHLGLAEWLKRYNSSYSGGRDQKDHRSKPAPENTFPDHISKNPPQKKGLWSGSR